MSSHLDKPGREEIRGRDGDYDDDGHGYTPIPLRWWYLSTVLGYIVLLLAVLEYSFHVIPQTSTRQTSPPTYFKLPPTGPFNISHSTASRPRLGIQTNTTDGFNSTFPSNSTATIGKPCDLDSLESITANTTNPTVLENCTVTTSDLSEPSTFKILHLDPSQFASLEPRTYLTHYRLHFVWVHDSTGRLYVPVFPGMDISQRCTYYGQYMYITTSKDDCRMLVDIDDFGTYAFLPLFERGDRCYDEWYTFTEQYAGQWGWQPQISGNDWDKSKCWEDEWDAGRTFEYPKRVVSWPAGWPTEATGDVAIPGPTKTTITTTLPPTLSQVTTTSTGADGQPTTSVFTTAIPGRVVTTIMDITPTPTASITVGGTVVTLTNSLGQPTATMTSFFTSGLPGVVAPSPSISLSTAILTDSQGRPTATRVIPVTITPDSSNPLGISTTLRTMYNQFGDPIATSTGYILPILPYPSPTTPVPPEDWALPGDSGGPIDISDIPSQAIKVQPLTWQSYFVGSFLPVILTTILSILIQILNGSLRALIPFLALARQSRRGSGRGLPPGASASDSLLLPLEGNMLRVDTAMVLAWKHKEPLLLMSNVLQISGIVLASLSSEAIGMTLGGGCRDDSFEGCFMSLAVVRGPGRAAEGLLGGMGVLLLGMMVGIWFLGRGSPLSVVSATGSKSQASRGRRTGLVRTRGDLNPTSILGAATMLAGEESKSLREVLGGSYGLEGGGQRGQGEKELMTISDKEIRERLEGHRFAMNSRGQIVLVAASTAEPRSRTGLTASSPASKQKLFTKTGRRITDLIGSSYDTFASRHRKLVTLLEYGYRVLFLAALGTLLFIVAYYASAKHDAEDPIESFMDSQTFGVSFLFTGAGGMIDFFWGGFFSRIELLEPYRYLSQPSTRMTPSRSASNMARPRSSSIFSGFFRAAVNGNILLSAVAFAGVLSKFLPVVLSNVPFRLTLTWTTYVICTWISVAVLAVMILVMIASFFVRHQPDNMPVDVGTIAGRMYYVCDSWFTRDVFDHRDGDLASRRGPILANTKYRFGEMVGVSGARRFGIDYAVAEQKYV